MTVLAKPVRTMPVIKGKDTKLSLSILTRAKCQPNFWRLARKLENYLELTKHRKPPRLSQQAGTDGGFQAHCFVSLS